MSIVRAASEFDAMSDEEFAAWENENLVPIPGYEKEFEEWRQAV